MHFQRLAFIKQIVFPGGGGEKSVISVIFGVRSFSQTFLFFKCLFSPRCSFIRVVIFCFVLGRWLRVAHLVWINSRWFYTGGLMRAARLNYTPQLGRKTKLMAQSHKKMLTAAESGINSCSD